MDADIERLSKVYENGIWLVNNKKGYVFVQEYEEKNIEYTNGVVLSTSKKEFERGELLRKIVSLNKNAIEPVVAYLRAEIALHRDAMPELNQEYVMPDSVRALLESHGIQPNKEAFADREEAGLYYKIDRLEELHYQIYHRLIQNMPFESLQSFSQNEVDLISQILLAECSQIYETKSFQLDEVDLFIPEIFWNDELREIIKDFLCEPSNCNEEMLDRLMQESVRIRTVVEGDKRYQVVNIRTFSELIALEVQNIMQSPSSFRRCTKCDICGRLFYKKQGKGENICDYTTSEGDLCKNVLNDEYEEYKRKVYNALKSYLQTNSIPGEKIYSDFHRKVAVLIKECREKDELQRFKDELDKWYGEIKEQYKDLNHYRREKV